MCNLSQGIKEKGRSEGRIEGRIEGERIGEERGEQRGIAIGEERGEQRGITIGKQRGENIMIQLFNRLMSTDRMEDWLRVTQDEGYRRQLIKELNIQ